MTYTIQPLTIIRASKGLQSANWTWGSLCFKAFGPSNPALAEAKKLLEETGFYDMGNGVTLAATAEVSKYHTP